MFKGKNQILCEKCIDYGNYSFIKSNKTVLNSLLAKKILLNYNIIVNYLPPEINNGLLSI